MEKKNVQPIDIILTTFNRLNFLKHTVKKIYERTKYPYKLWIVDNNSSDGTQNWLKSAKAMGYLHDYIFLPENKGLAYGLSEGFKKVKSDYFITTQDDVVPPKLFSCCWLEQMLHLFKKYENDYGGISMRTQRTRRRDVDELRDIIDSPPSLASFLRIQKKSDIEIVGGFGNRKHWESPEFMKRMKRLKKKLAIATHLYCEDFGFMAHNKGYAKDCTSYYTYSKERVNQGELQPYPDIDEKSCIPLKINTERDRREQDKREAYYDYWGRDGRKSHKTPEQKELMKYAEKGKGCDLGCGHVKIHQNAIGVDIYPHKNVDIVHDCRDLWMFKDEELDFIVNSHTLEHMPDFIAVLKEWTRVLKKGGILAIAAPDGVIKPKYIANNGHKVNLGLETMRIVFKRMLKLKTLAAYPVVEGKKENQHVFIIVGKKR